MEKDKQIELFNAIVKNFIPEAYWPLVYIYFFKNPKYTFIDGARASGKSTLLTQLLLLTALNEPYGNLLFLRNFLNQHKNSTIPAIDNWVAKLKDYYPSLNDFTLRKMDNKLDRDVSSLRKQEIKLFGTDKDGAKKIKSSEVHNGYVSLFIIDEAEDIKGARTEQEAYEDYQTFQTMIKTITRRDKRFQNNLGTKVLTAFNPKVDGSFQERYFYDRYLNPYIYDNLEESIKKLETDGIIFKYYPDYENGNGLLIAKTSLYAIKNSDNPDIQVTEEDFKQAIFLKEDDYRGYLNDVLGLRVNPINSIISSKEVLNNLKPLPKYYTLLSAGFDFGIVDKASMTILAVELERVYNNGELIYLPNYKNIFVYRTDYIDGLKGKGVKSTDTTFNRVKNVARTFLDILKKELDSHSLNDYHANFIEPFKLFSGPKDYLLNKEIQELIKLEKYNTIRSVLSKTVDTPAFLTSKWNTYDRVRILKQYFLRTGYLTINEQLTPLLVTAFLSLKEKNGKLETLKEYQDVLDSFFYAFLGIVGKVYNHKDLI